jgi:hypothetical protein
VISADMSVLILAKNLHEVYLRANNLSADLDLIVGTLSVYRYIKREKKPDVPPSPNAGI